MTATDRSQIHNDMAELRAARRGAVYRLETLDGFFRDACRRESGFQLDPAAQRQRAAVQLELSKISKLTVKTERKIATMDELALRLAEKLDRAGRWPILVRHIRELWLLQPEPRPSLAAFAAGLVAALPADGVEAFPGGAEDAERALQRAKKAYRLY